VKQESNTIGSLSLRLKTGLVRKYLSLIPKKI